MTALFKKRTLKTKKFEAEERPGAGSEVIRPVRPVELRSLVKWKAAVRPFKKRDRDFYTTIGAIVFLLAVILLFLKEWLLIAVLVALMFVTYVLATVPPETVEHEITTRGVVTGGKMYKWEGFKRFWFSKKWKDTILHMDTKEGFPARLMMLLGNEEQEKMKEMIQKYVQYEVPEETFMDRSAKWLSKKVPLEKE